MHLLTQPILRLKAIMPQAGCRAIADICNRRYAASSRITIGKTCVHRILQRHQYEIQILRRKLKHIKPKSVSRNLIGAKKGQQKRVSITLRVNLDFLTGAVKCENLLRC